MNAYCPVCGNSTLHEPIDIVGFECGYCYSIVIDNTPEGFDQWSVKSKEQWLDQYLSKPQTSRRSV